MKEGFKKIYLKSNKEITKPQAVKKKSSGKLFKGLGFTVVIMLVILAVTAVLLYMPVKKLYQDVKDTQLVAAEAFSVVKAQDIAQASDKLKKVEEKLALLQSDLSKFAFIKLIPFAGAYQSDAEHMIKGGLSGIQAAQTAVDTLVPYADLLGLKGKSTFVSGSADDRIKTAVETLDKIVPRLEDISQKISVTGQELNQIDPGRYPEKIGSTVIRSRLEQAKYIFSQTAELFVDAQPLLKNIPELLGNKNPKTYLVIFQNDAELRATGGFITAYALFKVDKGKMQVIKADDIYKLDEAKKKKFPAPPAILKYHKNVNNLELRDSNLSPDYNTSMKDFEKMLKEAVPDFPSFDGIITLDTHVLVSAIKVLGEFNVYGRSFTAENDKRCDCPKAIYELEDYSTKPVAYVREERKDIIGALLYQIMQRALGVSPSQYWGKLFQVLLEETKQKHVLFYFHNEEAQKGIEALNFGGRISGTSGDYLHINDVNFAGAKSNMFVREYVKADTASGNDGVLVRTLTIDYKNPAPASNCNLEAGQLCLNGILRNWVRIYVPKGSTLVDFTGSEKETVTYEDLGKTVFEGFLTVKPQGSTQIIVKYKLPTSISGKEDKLYIQKQPGTEANEYIIQKGGKQVEKFNLVTDKEVTIKM